jgi:cytochrome c5
MKRMGLLLGLLITVIGLAAAGCGAPATEVPPPPEPAATEAPAASTEVAVPAAFDGQAMLQDRCTRCHGLDKVTAASKNEAQWKVTIDRMVSKGAQLTPEEVQALAQFLANQ